jgi:KipI family sensor histidine kinase inhibitor
MNVLPYGPQGWLVELTDDRVVGYAGAAARHADVAEVVPAARTVLVRLRRGAPTADVGAWLATVEPDEVAAEPAAAIEIAVTYDGVDLADVAAASGLTPDEVATRHGAVTYHCAFCGFAPGFAYLAGLDPALRLPRRATPRTVVPAGSVAVADVYTAVYPSASPGGWHVIGRTDAALWDPERDPPALVAPGATVRFVAVR